METETTASARQREATYPDEKKRVDTDLEIFPGSNMLVRWVASSVRPSLECSSKTGARKPSPPDILMAGVQLCVFTLSRLALNCQKRVVPFLPPGVGEMNIRFRRLRSCVQEFSGPPVFLSHFNCYKSHSLAVWRLSALFIYLFNFNLLWAV